MRKFLIGAIIALAAFLGQAQTFVQPTGAIVGNQTVISIPVMPAGYPMKQALAYLPDDYGKTTKRYPCFVFLHGAGESGSLDITQVINTSLPQLIAQGLKPYNIDSATKDTVKWIVISPHCTDNSNCSYSYPQLQYTIPYLVQNYRIDSTCIWVGGLSAVGSGTWSVAMADTAFAHKYITGILPMANGGWDQNLAAYSSNLAYNDKHGLSCLYVIGDQDPGYNASGFFAYEALMMTFCQPLHYYDKVIVGGTHSANVWNLPFPLTARLWRPDMNSWAQMWSLRKNSIPPVNPLHAKIWIDSLSIHYPNTSVILADSSVGSHNYTTWGATAFPTAAPGRWASYGSMDGMLFANLGDGSYQIQLVIGDDLGNTDTAKVNVRVYGPPICPICPPPRTVTAILVNLFGSSINIPLSAAKLTYSDGNP